MCFLVFSAFFRLQSRKLQKVSPTNQPKRGKQLSALTQKVNGKVAVAKRKELANANERRDRIKISTNKNKHVKRH